MKIITHADYLPIPIRSHDWAAFDEDRIDGAPDAGIRSQRQGHGSNREEALRELAAQACEDYTDAELDRASQQALEDGDTTTLVFISYVREVAA